jgi:glycosyltransferase involved in cell wall biosynthesis
LSFSIVTATHERPEELREACLSVLQQTRGDFEHLIVDDGSPSDAASDVVSDLKDDRLRVIRLRRSYGPAGARNAAVREAHGQFLAVLDDDDLMLPDRLERSATFLECHRDHVLVAGAFEAIDADGAMLATVRPTTGEAKIREILPSHNPFCHSTCALRTEVFQRIGGYREPLRYAHDYDMVLRMAEQGRIEILGEPLSRYRFHTNNVSTRRAAMQGAFADIARETAICRAMGMPEELEERAGDVVVTETDPKIAAARAEYQLGEWMFRDGRVKQARPHLFRAWRAQPLRPLAIALSVASVMPGWMRKALAPLAKPIAAARYASWR